MDKKYLIINSGSASHKHALYQGGECLYFIHFEMIGADYVAHEKIANQTRDLDISEKVFAKSIEYTIARLLENKIITDKKDLTAIGIRVVAPGTFFQEHRLVDKEYVKKLKQDLRESPLHIKSVLLELKFIKKVLAGVPIVGISDSAFHKTMPDLARYYAIPVETSRRYGIYKYGYHGLSIQSVVGRLTARYGQLPPKVVVCHLGGGASVTAVLNGQSLDNSMGFTPTDGLVMASRVGNIDPGVVVYLSEKLGKRDGKMMDYFNKECGLLGLSNGKSDDIRELLKNEQAGDADSKLALDVYAYRVKKYIAQAVGALGGIDTLVFAGTVGERSMPMRKRICQNMEFFGLKLNDELNDKTDAVEAEISAPDSRTKITIIKTDEMGEIARETARVVSSN